MNFSEDFVNESKSVLNELNCADIEKIADTLSSVRQNGGRLFVIGSGGGAGHASHAVCDFRKLCNIEAYAPYDNVSELTARVNDEGWDVSIRNWLKVSRLGPQDCLFVFSVGGGNEEKKISQNIVAALELAKETGARIVGVVGKDGGYTKTVADAIVVIPTVNSVHITPLTEGFQAVVWHLLVSHPKLQINPTKWESTK